MVSHIILMFGCISAPSFPSEPSIKPPNDWAEKIAAGNMLFAPSIPDTTLTPTISNGFIGGDVGCSGGVGESAGVLHVAGIYGGFNPQQRYEVTRPAFPNPLAIQFSTNSSNYQVPALQYAGAALDLQAPAYFLRLEVPNCGDGAVLQSKIYAHRAYRSLLVMELSVIGGTSTCVINIQSCSGAPGLVSVIGSGIFQVIDPEQPADPTFPRVSPPIVAIAASEIPQNLTFNSNEKESKLFLAVVRTTLEPNVTADTVKIKADAELSLRLNEGITALRAYHKTAWEDAYGISEGSSGGGIEVGGNSSLAAKINSSLYYLLSSVRADWPYGISEGGIGSQSYNGHMFWSDGVMDGPLFAAINPPIADSLMSYRINRLAAAQSIAKLNHLRGAYWPWQSASTGFEQSCGNESRAMVMNSNPRIGCYWMHEIHVSADVALYFRLNYRRSGNLTFLRDVAWPVVSATADFFASRVNQSSDESKNWTLLEVIGPDEHSYIQDSNTYSNYVAGQTMAFAVEIAELIGMKSPSVEEWRSKSQRMYIPLVTMCLNYPNASQDCPKDQLRTIHPQYEGYHGQDINQADVVLMQWPFHADMDPVVAAADREYYAMRTSGSDTKGFYTGDSSYAIAFLFHGEKEQATEQFNLAFKHMIGDFNIWTELNPDVAHSTGHLNFITGAGGFIENLIFGYGGIYYLKDCLRLSPTLVPETDSLLIRGIAYLGGSIRMHVNSTHISLSRTSGPSLMLNGTSMQAVQMKHYPASTVIPSQAVSIYSVN